MHNLANHERAWISKRRVFAHVPRLHWVTFCGHDVVFDYHVCCGACSNCSIRHPGDAVGLMGGVRSGRR
jgi:hypothetical protein